MIKKIDEKDFNNFLEISGIDLKKLRELKHYKISLKQYVSYLKLFIDTNNIQCESNEILNFLLIDSTITNLSVLEQLRYTTISFRFSKVTNDFELANCPTIKGLTEKTDYIVKLINSLFAKSYNTRKVVTFLIRNSKAETIVALRKYLITNITIDRWKGANYNPELLMELFDRNMFLSALYGIKDLNSLPAELTEKNPRNGKPPIANMLFLNFRCYKGYSINDSILQKGDYDRLVKIDKYFVFSSNLILELIKSDGTFVEKVFLEDFDIPKNTHVFTSDFKETYINILKQFIARIYSFKDKIGKAIPYPRNGKVALTHTITMGQWKLALHKISFLINYYTDTDLINFYESKFIAESEPEAEENSDEAV
jgi:hypothetical protein